MLRRCILYHNGSIGRTTAEQLSWYGNGKIRICFYPESSPLGMPMNTPSRSRIALALLVAILAVSTASIFIRLAQREAPSLVIAATRLTLATLMLLPIAFLRHQDELRHLVRAGHLPLAFFSGAFLAIHFATWITSLEYTTVASSVVFVSTGPLWVALLSPLFLREPLKRQVGIGLVLATTGGIIIALGDACEWQNGLHCPSLGIALQGRALWGNFLALVGAWAVSGYLMIGRKLRARVSLVPYISVVYGIAAILLILVALWRGLSFGGYSLSTYFWMLLLALVPQLIGHSTYNWALRYLSATLVAITTLGEPIGSALLAYLILGEMPTPFTTIGGALILAGIYLASQSS